MRWPGSIRGNPLRRLSWSASSSASGLAISPNSAGSLPNMYSATPPEKVSAAGATSRGSGSVRSSDRASVSSSEPRIISAAAADQGELGRAAADIDVQDTNAAAFRQRHGARAVRGKPSFELVAGAGADEFASLRRKQFIHGARVAPFDRLAREDHSAAVDRVAAKARVAAAAFDEFGERNGVDQSIGHKRRQ